MAEKWIQHAIKHKGAATAKATAEGLPVHEWAAKHQHDTDLSGKQARLALALHHISQENAGDGDADDKPAAAKPSGMRSFY
jgi:hypothetical protein